MTKGSLQWHSRGSDSLLLCLGHFPASYMKINCMKNSPKFLKLFVHLQKTLIIAIEENVPDSQSFAYRPKHYHLFKQNVSSAQIFGQYLELWRILARFAWSIPLLNIGLA